MRKSNPTLSPLKEPYILWLENELTSEGTHPDHSYFELVWMMFEKEFTWGPEYAWSVDMDDNRLADGMELRAEFADLHGASRTGMNHLGPCSFIEVLIGLSRRLAFVAGGTAPRWAWQLLVNLGLDRMWDHLSRSKSQAASHIMDVVIQRDYEPNGVGGFFPLAWADRDQRKVELWYQLNAYVEELHPEH